MVSNDAAPFSVIENHEIQSNRAWSAESKRAGRNLSFVSVSDL
jgi:hypothetical protein